MIGKLEPASGPIPRLLIAAAAAALLAGCGLVTTQQQVLARADRNLAAHHYRAASVDLQNLIGKRPNDASLHVKLGEAFLHTGRYVESEANLREAQRLGAPWGKVLPGLAEAMLAEGRAQQVLGIIAAHRAAATPDYRLLSVQGRALLAVGKAAEAQAVLTQAVALHGTDSTARVALATLFERTGNAAAAKSMLDQTVAQAPQDYSAHFALGLWYAGLGRVRDAHGELARALELSTAGVRDGSEPDFDEMRALAVLADIELATGDLASAEKRVASLRKLAPQSAATLLLEARVAIAHKRMDDARAALEELLSRDPSNQQAKVLLGVASAATGDLGQADMYLSAALAANPRNLVARRMLAQVQLQERKPQAALKTASDPNAALDADLLAIAGRADLMKGDLSDATQFLERSEKSAPQDKVRTLELAAAYLSEKRPSDALQLLKRLEVPPDLVVHRELLLLVALSKTGSADTVGEEAKQFAAAHPRDMDALLLSVRALTSVKDLPGARQLIDEATQLDGRSGKPWVALGALEWLQKDRVAANQAFQRALQLDPRDTGAMLGEAEMALASGDHPSAIQHLEQVRSVAPRELAARVELARLYLEADQAQRADAPLAEARKLAPDDPDVQLLSGAVALTQSNASRAVAIFEQLVTRYPNSAVVQADLARAYFLAQRPDEARKACAEAVKLNPGYWPALLLETHLVIESEDRTGVSELLASLQKSKAPRALVELLSGDLAAHEGHPREALNEYLTAAATAPNADLALKISVLKHQLNEPDPDAPLRAWLQRSPADEPVRLALAQYLEAAGDRAGAVKEYQTVLSGTPDQLVALNNFAWLKLEAGDYEGALTLARKAYGAASANPAIADTFAWALVKTGNPLDALPVLRTAHHASPKDVSIDFHYAYALLGTGAKDEARRELESVVQAEPHGPEADQARSLLAGLAKPARR